MSAPTASLNAQQRAAVAHRGSSLLVLGGVGAGKTHTLVSRAVSLIDEGVDPNRILLLAFTRRAAAATLNKIRSLSSNEAAGQVWAGTLHSVANQLLRNYGSAAGLPASFTVVDSDDAVELFSTARSEEGFNREGCRFPSAGTLATIYSRMVNTQTKLSIVLQQDFPWCADQDAHLKAIFAGYTAKKRRSQILDVDDLLLFWRALLASPVAEAMRCMFDHILVDEYQDSSAIQAEIISLMRGPETEICAFGDDAQAIYRFRAATVENMWNFQHTYPGAKVMGLGQNYRSTAPILSLANNVLRQHPRRQSAASSSVLEHFDRALWTERLGGARPSLLSCSDESQQSIHITDKILSARNRGVALREQAVLYRAGHHGDALELELVRRDIPYVKFGGLKYLESAHIKDVLALLRVLENPDDELAWRRSLQMIHGIDLNDAKRLIAQLRVSKLNSDGLARFIDGVGRFPVGALEQAAELRAAYADCLAEPQRQTAPKMVEQSVAAQLRRLRHFCELTFLARYQNSAARLADIDQLATSAESYQSRSRFLTELTLDPPERTGDFAGLPHTDEDCLTLSTIHSAKGLEWRTVYLLHAADGQIPSEVALADAEGLLEELRLLYVALTRARQELTVSFPLRYHAHRYAKDDRHHFAQLSRFLSPLREFFDDQTAATPIPDPPSPNLSTIGVNKQVTGILEMLWE